jgi:cobalt-zinc-cadmium efflux system outer membrane protein
MTIRFAAALPLALLLSACSTAPPRIVGSTSSALVAGAVPGTPRLPRADEVATEPDGLDAPLTVERAVQAALLNHPEVRAGLARLDAAEAERARAGLLRNPMASLMALRPEGGGALALEYGLMQSVLDLFYRTRRTASAQAEQRLVEAEVAAGLVQLAQDTELAYYEAQTAESVLRVRERLLALETGQLGLVHRTAKAGLTPSGVVFEQQAMVSSREHDVHSAEIARTQARARLAQQLGLRDAQRLQLASAPATTLPAELDANVLSALAEERRADLHAADATADVARAEHTLQRGVLVTLDPQLGPTGMRDGDGTRAYGVQAQFALPVFDGGGFRRAAASARLAQAEASADAARRRVSVEVEAALGALLAARADLDAAERHLAIEERARALARGTYEQGAMDYEPWLAAERSRLSAELASFEARRSWWLALVALGRATGVASRPARE